MMLEQLVTHMGWESMAQEVPIRCFTHDPSISSSLKFLRRTPWARTKVEDWFAEEAAEFPPEAQAG